MSVNIQNGTGSMSWASISAKKVTSNGVGRSGTFTATSNAPLAVAAAGLTANSVVLLTVKTANGANAGEAIVTAVTAGTGFTVLSGAADTSVYNYTLLEIA